MEKGQITEEGHYDDLMTRGMSFSKLMSTHNEHLDELFKKNENVGSPTHLLAKLSNLVAEPCREQ